MIRWPVNRVLFSILVCFFALTGCGGGSAGTGTREFSGVLATRSNQPLAGALVTVVPTGDSALTGVDGSFSILTGPISGDVSIFIEYSGIQTTVVVPGISEGQSTVHVTVRLDPQTAQTSVSDLEVLAQIAGSCDIYFENMRTIRQANRAPQGVECLAKVWIKGDGRTIGGAPFIMQRRRCPQNSPWITAAKGETLHGTHSGVGILPFPFFDDSEHCVYRIVAPYDYQGWEEVIYEIHTFTKQAYDRARS